MAAAWALAPLVAAAEIYKWTDASGEVHYTDDRSSIPRGAKVETTSGGEIVTVPAAPPLPKRAPAEAPAPPPPKPRGPVEMTLVGVETEVSPGDLELIRASLAEAAASPRIAEWGLRESVEVKVMPVERMVRDAFGQANGPRSVWLRAPRDSFTFGRPLPYTVTALHELAHVIEFQHAQVLGPRWFTEGFAEYVAQHDPFATMEDVAWWVIKEGGPHPLMRAFSALESGALNYAIAHAAVQFLASLVTDDGLRRMLQLRGERLGFEAAFARVAGFTVDEFERRFVESLRPHFFERATVPQPTK